MIPSLLRRLADADRRLAARLRRRAGVAPRQGSADGGFALIETVIAISLIVLVMAAFSVFFVNTVAFTSLQRSNQTATRLANSAVESVRVLPASDVASKTSAAITLLAAGPQPVVIDGIRYTTTVTTNPCLVTSATLADATCTAGATGTGIAYTRASVTVAWSGSRCPSTGCTYSTATLINATTDPKFAPSQTPPPQPVLTNPGAQTSAVGDVVDLQLGVSAVPSYKVNLTGGTLPAGLVLDTATGRITGSPVTVAPATTLTFTLTDGYERTTTMNFGWTIVPVLAAETPPAQAGVIGTPVPTLTVRASGGTGPYTWADPGATLPPGLSLATTSDAAVVNGTPTTYGTFPVTLQVTDAAGRRSTSTFTWTVRYPPFAAANPGPQTSTAGTPDVLQLTVTGGSGSFAWTGGDTLPAGLTLTAAGAISGSPTTAGTKTVTLVATDTVTTEAQTVAFTWTIYAAPTVTAPGAQQSTTGSSVSVQVGAVCPNSPCSFVLNNGPATLGVSATGLITGTITSEAQTFGAVTVTMTDASGASVISAPFSWTVVANAPSAPQAVTVKNDIGQLVVSWAPPTSGATPTQYVVTLSPGGNTCTTTGALTCTVTGLTNGTVYTATVTAAVGSAVGPASVGARGIPYPAVLASTGLTLWLDGADPNVFTTASGCTGATATTTIGCWRDKSGASRNFLQTSTANQPVVGTWNGLPAANFLDTGDVLNAVSTGSYQTVFTAANILNSGSAAQWVDVFGQANNDFNVRLGTNGERSSPNANDWSSGTGTAGAPLNWINGAQGVRGSPPGPMITTDQAASVKTFAASVSNTVFSRGVIGQIGDVITFNRVLSAAERRSVEEYLARKWGVPIVPSTPTSVTAERASTNNGANNGIALVRWTAPEYIGGTSNGYTVKGSPGNLSCTTTTTSCTFDSLARGTTYSFTVTMTNSVGTSAASNPATVVP